MWANPGAVQYSNHGNYIIQDNTIHYKIDIPTTTGDFPGLVQALQ